MGPPLHLSARQAAGIARQAGARELALTHVWPTLDPRVSLREAREAAGGSSHPLGGAGRDLRNQAALEKYPRVREEHL